jgi:hypothetical protein
MRKLMNWLALIILVIDPSRIQKRLLIVHYEEPSAAETQPNLKSRFISVIPAEAGIHPFSSRW